MNSYQSLGLSLIAFGAILFPVSYFIVRSIPLSALGIGSIIIGAASAMLPSNAIPKRIVREMLRNSATNIEAILEEFNVSGKALFLPPRNGYVTAFITLEEVNIQEVADARDIPLRVLSIASGRRGITVFPPGSELAKAIEAYQEASYEHLLSNLLVNEAEMASSVKVIDKRDKLLIGINNPRIIPQLPRFNRSLGTLPSCIAASCAAFKLKKRVAIEEEMIMNGKILLTLSIFEHENE